MRLRTHRSCRRNGWITQRCRLHSPHRCAAWLQAQDGVNAIQLLITFDRKLFWFLRRAHGTPRQRAHRHSTRGRGAHLHQLSHLIQGRRPGQPAPTKRAAQFARHPLRRIFGDDPQLRARCLQHSAQDPQVLARRCDRIHHNAPRTAAAREQVHQVVHDKRLASRGFGMARQTGQALSRAKHKQARQMGVSGSICSARRRGGTPAASSFRPHGCLCLYLAP